VANVPVPIALRDELRLSDLVVWEAKRAKKGEPVSVSLAGPGIETRLYGYGDTIEDAVAAALVNPHFLQTRAGIRGAMARLDDQLYRLRTDLWIARTGFFGDDLDDDVPF
jgi:hypothetical protein